MRRILGTLVALLLAAPGVRAGVVAAPGSAVHTVRPPGTVEGGVVRQGDAILVGQGPSFAAGAQSIVRLDAGGPTTIATGFNSLGGFDLASDGTLYVVDNCFTGDGCGTTTTGDTVYAIPDALTRTTAVTAAGHEVVPPGTIPFASDVFGAPGGAALVSDAAGNGAGRVVKVVPGMATELIGGLDLVGGITLAADGTLRIVDAILNLDFSTTGKVLEYQLDGTPLGTLVSGLAGGFAAATDGAGNVLVSGIGSAGASKGIAAAPHGSGRDPPPGFGFSRGGFFHAARDGAPLLDLRGTGIVDGVLDATIPGGAFDPVTRTGWKAKKNGAFSYHKGAGGILGIARVALEPSSKTPGLVRFAVGGKTGSYAVDPAHLPRQATLILDAAAGQCGDAGFVGPAPAPVCVYKAKHAKVQCK